MIVYKKNKKGIFERWRTIYIASFGYNSEMVEELCDKILEGKSSVEIVDTYIDNDEQKKELYNISDINLIYPIISNRIGKNNMGRIFSYLQYPETFKFSF